MKEKQLMDAIVSYINDKGYSPTVRELGRMVGLKSSSTIHKYFGRLKCGGLITWEPKSPRTIQVSENGTDKAV